MRNIHSIQLAKLSLHSTSQVSAGIILQFGYFLTNADIKDVEIIKYIMIFATFRNEAFYNKIMWLYRYFEESYRT